VSSSSQKRKGQRGGRWRTHSNNLLDLENAHLAPVEIGTGPFRVEHFERDDVGRLWRDLRRWRRESEGGGIGGDGGGSQKVEGEVN
jgi:hypothetical protein